MGVEKERMKSEDECIYDSFDRICLGEILCIDERYRHGRKKNTAKRRAQNLRRVGGGGGGGRGGRGGGRRGGGISSIALGM